MIWITPHVCESHSGAIAIGAMLKEMHMIKKKTNKQNAEQIYVSI